MRVVLFHPVELPPRNYGGVERVVLWLAQGLMERGHEVHVAALSGSRLPQGVRLVEIPERRRSALDLPRFLPSGTDVVHFMAPPESGAMDSLPCPSLLTVHGNGNEGERFPLNSVFLCADHARRHGGSVFVYNGIHPSECEFRSNKSPDLLFLSRTSWRVKNLRGAMRLARRAREKLLIAGGSRPVSARISAFFSKDLRWVGAVSGKEKSELLASAKALLFPVVWPEPFGLVVVESLLSGTPVLASETGSLTELITPETGALLPVPHDPESPEWEDKWIDAIRRLSSGGGSSWSAEACRAWAMSRFLYSHMAEGYEGLYKKVIQGNSLHSAQPVASDWRIG